MTAKLIRSLQSITAKEQRGILTIGNFDGVHIGHQKLLKTVIAKADPLKAPSLVLTFEPHPFEFFAALDPNRANGTEIPRLTRLREKFTQLSDCGIQNVIIMPFNQELANMSATAFATEILVKKLQVRHIIVGDDFHFGYKREGDFAYLKTLGVQHNFTVSNIQTVLIDNERVSSTRVRKALAEGNHELVKRLLGHSYFLMGRVRKGDQRGRQWGFPTANIFLHRKLSPVRGVYTVLVHGISAAPKPGVANVGLRPTVDGTRALLEVHLLDFNEDIYGRHVSVEFLTKLRDEFRYPNIDLLKEQIAKDVIAARDYFNNKI